MARCPECGGSIGPGDLASLKPGAQPCRWCGALLVLPRWGRLTRDGFVVIAGFAIALPTGIRMVESADPLWAFAGVGGIAAAVGIGVLIEMLLPLHAVRPRGVAPWRLREFEERERLEELDDVPEAGESQEGPPGAGGREALR